MSRLRLALVLVLILSFASATSIPALHAAGLPPPPGLQLQVSPQLVGVGQNASFTVTARSWPARASVTLSFVSPHHGFTGQMLWEGQCSCFRLAVYLAKRVHSLEQARATANVVSPGGRATAYARFAIRGLAPGGKGYAPGGTPSLTGWVSDPTPTHNESQHYCAWVSTADGLGVAGMRVRFVVHYAGRSREWIAGFTPATGVVCIHRQLSGVKAGVRVKVDVYAGNLHTSATFVPR